MVSETSMGLGKVSGPQFLKSAIVLFFQANSLPQSPEAGTSRKRPNIISRRGRKFRRKSVSATDAIGGESSESSDVDADADAEEKVSSHGPKFPGEVKSGSIKCRFCGKEYQHLKARNKHLVSDHFEECKKVRTLFWGSILDRDM